MYPFQKIYRLTISVLAILVLMTGLASAAVSTRTLTVGTVSGTVGTDVLVPITIDSSTDVAGIAFTLTYDPAVLTFVSLEQATPGWTITNPETAYKVPTADVLQNVTYYNPYKKEAPYADRTYNLAANATLFYQYNDVKDSANASVAVGKVLVSGASAVPLTGTVLFKAKFTIAAGLNGTTYPIQIARSIINNTAAGYPASGAFIPALVSAGTMVDGKYTSLDFPVIPATLVSGGITVSATTYSLGGKVTYATTPVTNAGGCTVILKKETPAGSGIYIYNAETITGADGTYSFTGKAAGKYKLAVTSLDPSYNNYESSTAIAVTNANVTGADVTLVAKPQPDYVTGTVTGTIPTGLMVKVVDVVGSTETRKGVYSVGADGKWSSDLLPPATGAYHWYLVYGSLSSAKDATTFDTSVLKTISGTIAGLPTGGGAVTVISTAGNIQKTLQVTADGAYTVTQLVAANDYIVSAVATGFPLTYYNGKTDVSEATAVDISTANATAIDFTFVAPTKSITGWIKDSNVGVAIGTAVYAFDVNTFAMISTQTTDANGNYSLGVPQGSYEVFVIKSNGKIFYFNNADGTPTQNESSAVLKVVTATDTTLPNTNISITECDKTLSGSVTYRTANGDPAANVLVEVFNDTKQALGLTGQDGKYAIGGLCTEAYSVSMKPLTGNYPAQTTSITVTGDIKDFNFIIDTGAVLSGTVTDSISSAKVSGAMIYLKDKATGALVGGRIYFSATDGTYSIRDIESNEYTLEVTHPDYQGYTVDLVIGSDMTQDVALVKGAYFKGTVTDSSTTKPLAGATIIVTRVGGTPVYTVTNSVGAYSVYGLDSSLTNYIIIAQRRGYERQAKTGQQPVTAGTTVDFALAPPTQYYTVSGTVKTDAPAGINGAIVLVSSATKNFFASTTTDTNGAYSVANLIASTDYNIVVIPPGLPTQTGTFTVGPNATKDFTIPVGKDIGGTISSTTTIPSATKIYVFLYQDTTYKGFQVADGTGAYLFKGLTAGTGYKIFAVATGYTPQWYSGASTIGTATTIDISSQSKTDASIVLVKQ